MEASQWSQNVLLVTMDPEIREKISSSFGSSTSLKVVETSEAAIDHLTDFKVDAVIIDAKATIEKTFYFENKEVISFQEISQYANQLNNHLPIVILTNALLSKDGSFAAKCGATLIMDRKDISLNKLVYVLRVLRKRTFRTILTRDLKVGESYSVDLYHYLSVNRRYLPFLRAGEVFTEEKKLKVNSSETRHLYAKEDEFRKLLQELSTNQDFCFSEELADIQFKFRKLHIDFFNISTDGALHFGKLLQEDGYAIIERIEKLVNQYPDAHTCLKELPYPRWSALAHGINSAIYAVIFAKASGLEKVQDIAFASLIHNIGLAEIDQNTLKKKESDLSSTEMEEYKRHVGKSLELIQRKKMLISPLVEKIISQHHENYDGTGYPERLSGDEISLEASLLSILASFDYLHTVRPGEKAKNIYEVWGQVKCHHAESTLFFKKFHPKLIERLDQFFARQV